MIALVAGMLVVVLSGCSLLGPRTQTISVSTAPSGAEVYVNGTNVGKTPRITSYNVCYTKLLRPSMSLSMIMPSNDWPSRLSTMPG